MPADVQTSTDDMAARSTKDARLNLRITSRQAQLLRRAAAAEDQSVTDFVLQSAAQEAERVLADRRWMVFSEEEWASFSAALDQPAADPAALRSLLHTELVIDLSDL